MKKNIKDILQHLPKQPGVYQFFNKSKKIIYIGKSVNLNSRVKSYFHGTASLNFAKKKMVGEIDDIKILITHTSKESLILETSLIKKYQPKYNILMKDDKNHLYIKITDEEFPRIKKTRIKTKSGSYFGPYTSGSYVDTLLQIINKIFGNRMFKIDIEEINGKLQIKNYSPGMKIPHITYYLAGGDIGAFLKANTKAEYLESMEDIKHVLGGNIAPIKEAFHTKMLQYAQNLEFEKATSMKQNIAALDSLSEHQGVRDIIGYDCDVINFLEKYGKYYITKIEVRQEKIMGIYNFELQNKLQDLHESVIYFLEQQYLHNKKTKKILLPQKIENSAELSDDLHLEFIIPYAGEKKDILTLAYKNAFEFAYKKHLSSLSTKGFTKKDAASLLETLNYSPINDDIVFECVDISHMAGSYSVASKSVMLNGKLSPTLYKKYKIKTLIEGEIDDFAAMKEIISRRVKEISTSKYIPDLLIIDGGKGQLSSIESVIQESLQNPTYQDIKPLLEQLQIISLAERDEEIFFPFQSKPLILGKDDNHLRMLQQIRDEAHRFAVAYNTTSRHNAHKKNILEELPGIGPKTRAKLLKHYGSVYDIKKDEVLSTLISSSQLQTLEDHGII